MKPLSEEKTDLKPELKLFSLILFFLLADTSLAQIPLNGFCKLDSYQVQNEFTYITPVNFNRDSYMDLLLFNPGNRKVLYMESTGVAEFNKARQLTLPKMISSLEPVYSSSGSIDGYAFISRESRSFGLLKFSNSGQPVLKADHVFLSYPHYLSAADVNRSGSSEYLVSGPAFDGISLLSIESGRVIEMKIAERASFSFAHFVDLNNDGATDIAAFNRLNSKINLYFNNSFGNFSLSRQIEFFRTPSQLKSFDINYDTFNDLVISTGKEIHIILSDYSASYDSALIIKTNYNVDDFVIGDFNNDGYFDFVYVSKDAGVIASIFGKPDGGYYPEFIHLKRNRINSISTFISKFIFGVTFLGSDGEIGIISSLRSVSEDFDLAVSIAPVKLGVIDNEKNGIKDFVFVDSYNGTINFLFRNKSGIPDKFFSKKMLGSHNSLVVDDSGDKIKRVFCYSLNSKLIEIITFNTLNGTIRREQIYTPGLIQDVKVYISSDGTPSLSLLYRKNQKLIAAEIKDLNSPAIIFEHKAIAETFIQAEILPVQNQLVSFWKTSGGQIQLKHKQIRDSQNGEQVKYSLPFQNAEIFSSSFVSEDQLIYNQFFIINSDGKTSLVFGTNQNVTTLNLDRKFPLFRIKNKNNLSFNLINDNFFYNDATSSIWRAELSGGDKRIRISEIFKDINLLDLVITNLDFRNRHLIFINEINGSISVRKLK